MRVIAGKAKRIQLSTIKTMDTRPTTDRIKETLFNMIAHGLYDCTFLDLFAGSGAIGIEALSRGASHCVFVENSPAACKCIKENLEKTKLISDADVMMSDVLTALRRLEGKQVFDYIFMDPPYDNEFERKVLEYLSTSTLINEDSLIIVEASISTDLSYIEDLGFSLIKRKDYKTNSHIFLERSEAEC